MSIAEIEKICMGFKGVTEDIKWEHHLCFNIGGKMFLITSPDELPHTASFKTDEEDFEILREREGFLAAPYLARNRWIKITDTNLLSPGEWAHYLYKSYKIIAAKLPARMRKELGI